MGRMSRIACAWSECALKPIRWNVVSEDMWLVEKARRIVEPWINPSRTIITTMFRLYGFPTIAFTYRPILVFLFTSSWCLASMVLFLNPLDMRRYSSFIETWVRDGSWTVNRIRCLFASIDVSTCLAEPIASHLVNCAQRVVRAPCCHHRNSSSSCKLWCNPHVCNLIHANTYGFSTSIEWTCTQQY